MNGLDVIPNSADSARFAGKRVLVIGSNAYEDSFEWHVNDSLQHMGCVVKLTHKPGTTSGVANVAGKALQKLTQTFLREPERLNEQQQLRTVAEFKPDVILVLLGSQVSPKTVAAIRRVSAAPMVCWCQDQLTTLGRQYLLGAGYDAVFVKDRYMQDLFSRMIRSTTFHYLPEACNIRVHRPFEISAQDKHAYGCELMIAGTLYYYRQEILQQLVGFDIKIWGHRPDWLMDRMPGRFMGRDVRGEDKVRAARAAIISLNTLHYAEVNGLNCRAFELAGCGGFQMLNFVPAVAEHFEQDVEVVVYHTVEELREKARYYIDRPDLARTIADRGRIRAHRDHTYEQRLGEILGVALNTTTRAVGL